MATSQPLPRVPLTETEKYHLQTIYGSRIRLFAAAYGIMLLYTFIGAFSGTGTKMKHLTHRSRSGRIEKNPSYDYNILGHDLTDTETYWLTTGLLKIIIVGTGCYVFFKKIYPYKKDVNSGMKEVVTYTITDKKYFPLTNQYYVSFDNPNYMHYEVDMNVYYSVSVGEGISIYRGIYSKQVFEKDGRFTLM